jgi:PAS domain S-box-containing protein
VVLRALGGNGFLAKSDDAQCASLFDSGLGADPAYSAFLLLDASGRCVCPMTSGVSSPSTDPPYVADVIRVGRPLVGMPTTGRLTGNARLPIAQPVLDASGRVQRILVVGLRIDTALRQALDAFAQRDASFALIDQSGNVLFRAVGEASGQVTVGREHVVARPGPSVRHIALSERTDIDGVARVFAQGPPIRLSDGGIQVVAGVDRSVVAERADREFALDVISIVTLAACMALGVWLLGDRLVRRPVVELGQAARRLSAGDFSAAVDSRRFNGEFVALAAAFNEMAACIRRDRRELQSREERLRLMTSCVDDYAIVMLDPTGRIVTWSAAAECMHGFREDEAIGRACDELYAQSEIDSGAVDRLRTLALGAGRAEARLLRVRRHGGTYHACVTLGAMRDPGGELIGFAEITRDISDEVDQEARRAASASRVRALLRRVVSVQEAERRSLSADLHDLIGQHVSALGIEVENMRMHVTQTDIRAGETLDRMARLTAETMQAVRSTMAHLRPPLLDDYGLAPALVAFCRDVERRSGLCVAVVQTHEIGRLASDIELALFRIAQEAVSNSVKHSGASKVTITLYRHEDTLCVEVADDGLGFVEREGARAARRGGWGLQIMRERAQAVGGHVRVEFPGSGTRVVAEVPIEDQDHPR